MLLLVFAAVARWAMILSWIDVYKRQVEAVIAEGVARKLDDDKIPQQAFTDYKAKYAWELDPKMGPVFEVRPRVVFAMPEKQFPKGVTRWKFE